MSCNNITIKQNNNEIYNFNKDKHLVCLLGEEAQKVANYFKNKKIITTTQYRKFYDKVIELAQKAQNSSNFEVEVLPFVKMLISKAQYSANRKACRYEFVKFMKKSINGVENKEHLDNFKLFLEAIIGFMPRK